MSRNNLDILQQLRVASADLLWMSESDYPFEVFTYSQKDVPEMNEIVVLEKMAKQTNTPIKTVEFEQFFQLATTEKEWHNASEKETVKQYQNLVSTLQENLENLQVYLIGETEIDVYILGKLPSGDWAVLSTKMVQT
ncbi:MAG: nuclease A inhibitor family protein [Spirulinaceae cyanobacterium]